MASRGGGRNRIKDAQVPNRRQLGSWGEAFHSSIASRIAGLTEVTVQKEGLKVRARPGYYLAGPES
jgi:hypothetical protein